MRRLRFYAPPARSSTLKNHVTGVVTVDFFVLPAGSNQARFVFPFLAHCRRRVLHFNVIPNPTSEWTAQQIVETFPWDEAPRYLLRDRDRIFGDFLRRRVTNIGIEQVVTPARSPWQNPYLERLIGSIRRECPEHVIVLNERHLKRILSSYFRYYHRWRTHQGLVMESPDGRETEPHERGSLVEVAEVGGLHHHYERSAA